MITMPAIISLFAGPISKDNDSIYFVNQYFYFFALMN